MGDCVPKEGKNVQFGGFGGFLAAMRVCLSGFLIFKWFSGFFEVVFEWFLRFCLFVHARRS